MADINRLVQLTNGKPEGVDLQSNSLVVGSLKGGSVSPTELTKTLLDRLLTLQDGSDVANTYHHHDGRYFTEAELSSATSSSGSDLIGDDNTYTNFTPTAATVKGALAGINTALGSLSGANTALSNLSAVAINTGLQSGSANTHNLGNSTFPWLDLYINTIYNSAGIQGIDVNNYLLKDATGTTGIDWNGRLLKDSSGNNAFDWEGRNLLDSSGTAIAGWSSTGINMVTGKKVTNLADPTAAQDAATKAYVDALAAGIKPKQAVRAATTANLSLATDLENGDSIDGVTLATGDRVLVKDQSTTSQNGIYVVQASGAAVRATDFDSITPVDEINGAYTLVQEGTANAGKAFVQYGVVATVGTDPILFTTYAAAPVMTGGDMITVSGADISVDLATSSGLESTNPGNAAGQLRIKLEATNPTLRFTGSNELAAKLDAAGAIQTGASGLFVAVDDSTIERNSNALRIKDAGVTLAKMASNSVDENKLVSTVVSATGAITGGGGSKLAVQVDGSSVEINSNALRIKTTAYDQDTITGGSGSAAAVQSSPMGRKTVVAGESMAANTSFAVRLAVSGETAGRYYKADQDATSLNNFFVIGLALSTGAVSAGGNTTMIFSGTHTLGSSDTAFNAADVGKPVYLTATGAFSVTAPSTPSYAVTRIGIVETTTKIFVQPQFVMVN